MTQRDQLDAAGRLVRRIQDVGNRIAGLERQVADSAAKVARVEQSVNTVSIPGLAYVASAPRLPTILEVADLAKLGTAAGRTWFAWEGHELRVDVEGGPELTGDNLPANRIILHATERVPDQTVDTGDPATPWRKGQRKLVRGHEFDRYWRCTVMPSGSFAVAQARDATRVARRNAAPRREPTPPRIIGPANAQAAAYWQARRAGGER
jgi:hypothetical protein